MFSSRGTAAPLFDDDQGEDDGEQNDKYSAIKLCRPPFTGRQRWEDSFDVATTVDTLAIASMHSLP